MPVCGYDQMMQVGDPGSSSTFAKSVSLFHKVVILHERSKSGTRLQTPKVKHAYLRETCLSACGKSLIIQLCLLHVFLTSTRKIHSFSRPGIWSRGKFTRVTMCTENCFTFTIVLVTKTLTRYMRSTPVHFSTYPNITAIVSEFSSKFKADSHPHSPMHINCIKFSACL